MAGIEYAAWMPSPGDAAFYDTLFRMADATGTGEIQGAAAVEFFKKSGLDRSILRQEDADRDGFVTGQQAVALFSKSGLDKLLLRHIWNLSDIDKDTRLDKEEFSVAMHLVVGASKRGMTVPEALPAELVPLSKRAFMGHIHAQMQIPTTPSPTATATAPAVHSQAGIQPDHLVGGSRRPSGSLALSDALDAHLPDLQTRSLTPQPITTAPTSVSGVPPMPPARKPSYSGIALTPEAAHGAQMPGPSPSNNAMAAPEITATAKGLESAMQSHLKRENTLLNDRRALVETATQELKYLESERQVFLKQIESVRQQISDEDAEFRKVAAASQVLRAEIAQLREQRRRDEEALSHTRQQTSSAASSLSALVTEFTNLGGAIVSLDAGIRSLLEARTDAQATARSMSEAANTAQQVSSLHSAASAASHQDVAQLEGAIAHFRQSVERLTAEHAALRASLSPASELLHDSIAKYEEAMQELERARTRHVSSVAKETESKAELAFLKGKDAALTAANLALEKLKAAMSKEADVAVHSVNTIQPALSVVPQPAAQVVSSPVTPASAPVANVVSPPASVHNAADGFGGFEDSWSNPPAIAASSASAANEWAAPVVLQGGPSEDFSGFESFGTSPAAAPAADAFGGFDSFTAQPFTAAPPTTSAADFGGFDDFGTDSTFSQPAAPKVTQPTVDEWTF